MERVDHGLHVFRTYCLNSFLKQYEKALTFLRLELVSNNVRDFGLRKSLILTTSKWLATVRIGAKPP